MSEFPRVTLAQQVMSPEMALPGIFLDRALARGLTVLRADDWPTAERSLAPLGEPLVHHAAERRESGVFEWHDVLLFAGRFGSHAHAVVAGAEARAVAAAFVRLHELLRPPDPSTAHEVPVTFWTYSPHGPQPSWRTVGVPEWDEIAANYAAATREKLAAIMRGFRPAHGGQLVLWHGEAGTGKTFALRALAWEWRDWCEFHYIVDPDTFFGEHADYLMSVLMEEGAPMVQMQRAMQRHVAMGTFVMVDGDEELEQQDDERAWRVLVLEDTGELLSSEARVVIGQGLSRFLNVVDGLIGQGLRVLVLVTTNEEIRSLHPAVARPGRAAANVEFVRLSADESRAWLRARELDVETGPSTIASLYALAEGRDPESVSLSQFAQ